MHSGIDLLGCEYLGGCPTVGSRVLNKVQLHFDNVGVTVSIAPQGLFTPAAARPVLVLAWSEITTMSATNTSRRPTAHAPRRFIHSLVKVLTTRLDLPDNLLIGTPSWTMTIGVRVAAAELGRALQELLAGCAGPVPALTAP